MTMSLNFLQKTGKLGEFLLAAGYESGHANIYSLFLSSSTSTSASSWSTLYTFKSHIQPTLSVAIHPSQESFYSSSADATIAHHPIALATHPIASVNTKHSGQTSL